MPLFRPALAALALMLGAQTAMAAPAMWKASDADSAVWLFGSVHMLAPGTDWRTPALDKIMSKADRVYFETDISPEGQAAVVPLTVEMGFSRDGRLLSEVIGPEMTARLREAAAAADVPMPLLLTMRPWMAAITLSIGPVATTGFDPLHGVEATLEAELRDHRVGQLESLEEQMMFLAGGSEAEQIQMLEAVLDTMGSASQDIEMLIDAWVTGQPELLGEMFAEQTAAYGDSMMGRLIDERNRNWTVQIEQMLEAGEQSLLVVGAAHLAGDASVLLMLEQRGYRIERVQ